MAYADEGGYRKPPHVLAEYADRAWPHRAVGRGSFVPFPFQTWQQPRAALGSMSAGVYTWQQVHCMAAVGDDEHHRAVAMIPGNFCSVNGYVAQKDNTALCVFNRCPNSYVWTHHALPEDRIRENLEEWRIFHCAIGLTEEWRIESESEEGIVARAFGHTLTLRPFLMDIEGKEVRPVHLGPWPSTAVYHANQKHRFARERTYPGDAMWFGCHVALDEDEQPRPPPAITVERRDRMCRTTSDDGLSVDLFLQPTGETTHIFDTDWRTTPLLDAPAATIWPGEMARASATRPGGRCLNRPPPNRFQSTNLPG